MEEIGRLFGDEVAGTLEGELKHHDRGDRETATSSTEGKQ